MWKVTSAVKYGREKMIFGSFYFLLICHRIGISGEKVCLDGRSESYRVVAMRLTGAPSEKKILNERSKKKDAVFPHPHINRRRKIVRHFFLFNEAPSNVILLIKNVSD